MTRVPFSHRCEYRIRLEPGSDDRAPGGAVTVALCGHWDHDGRCRWPHLSTITPDIDGYQRLVVEFDAPENEVVKIKALIDPAVTHGELTGPDGLVSIWVCER
jgi:hypothetical protein